MKQDMGLLSYKQKSLKSSYACFTLEFQEQLHKSKILSIRFLSTSLFLKGVR